MKSSIKSLLGWLGVLALLVLGSYFSWKALREAKPQEAAAGPPGGMPPSTVIVRAAERRDVAETLTVTGTLRAVRRAEIAALEPAAVSEIHVDEGDNVKKGDLIATLDGRRLAAQSEEAKAALTMAEAQLAQREAELVRAHRDKEMMESLWKDRAIAEREFLDSSRGLQVAISIQKAATDSIEAAKKRLELFEVRVSDLQVVAPFDGRIVARHAELGEWLREGDPVVTLVSTGEIEAWLQLPERHAMRLAETAPEAIDIRLPDRSESARADKVRVVPDVDGRSRLFTVIVHLPDAGTNFTPGTSVTATLPLGAPVSRTVVPVDAVMKGYSGSYVYIPTGSPPMAKRVDVQVLFQRDADSILADGDLKPGNEVIVEGNERLMPGAPVDPKPWTEVRVAAGDAQPQEALKQ